MQRKHANPWIFYLLMVSLFAILTFMLFNGAEKFDKFSTGTESMEQIPAGYFDSFIHSISHNIAEPTAILLVQIISILLVSRILGFLFIKIGQSTVIAEILAGILLGPSLLGYFYPEI